MIYGSTKIILPDSKLNNIITHTLSNLDEINSSNVLSKDGNFNNYFYSRGIVLLGLDIYNKFKFFTHLFNFKDHPDLETIIKRLINYISLFI